MWTINKHYPHKDDFRIANILKGCGTKEGSMWELCCRKLCLACGIKGIHLPTKTHFNTEKEFKTWTTPIFIWQTSYWTVRLCTDKQCPWAKAETGKKKKYRADLKPLSQSGNVLVCENMLPGESVAYSLRLLSFFCLESYCSSVCCSQQLSTLLSQSAPPTSFPPLLFTHSTFSLLQPSWVQVSRLLAFYPHSLHTPHLPSLSTNAGWPFFTPTTSSTLYPASALFSQANHAEVQCNCANVSYPSLGSLHPSAGLFECKQRKTTPLGKTSRMIYKKGFLLQRQKSYLILIRMQWHVLGYRLQVFKSNIQIHRSVRQNNFTFNAFIVCVMKGTWCNGGEMNRWKTPVKAEW